MSYLLIVVCVDYEIFKSDFFRMINKLETTIEFSGNSFHITKFILNLTLIIMFVLCTVIQPVYCQLRVNEIMFKPISTRDEWFELVNVSDSVVCLCGFTYKDYQNNAIVITNDSIFLDSNEYLIVARIDPETLTCEVIVPMTWRQLNDTGIDGVIIISPDSVISDSTFYDVSWFSSFDRGISIERKDITESPTDSANWYLSTDSTGSTPCIANSNPINDTTLLCPKLVITEIMFKPESFKPEWIEIYNADTIAVNINGFEVRDQRTTITITEDDLIIDPGDYLIVSNAFFDCECPILVCENFTGLNNLGETMYLINSRKVELDTVTWEVDRNWLYDVSIELISINADGNEPSNWLAATIGSTPCADNSVWGLTEMTNAKIDIDPNPFTPGASNCIIKVIAPLKSTVEIRIYDILGHMIIDFKETRMVSWDGCDKNGNIVLSGAYVVVAKVENGDGSRIVKSALAIKR